MTVPSEPVNITTRELFKGIFPCPVKVFVQDILSNVFRKSAFETHFETTDKGFKAPRIG
jgi:hypothetical protein